MAFDFEDNKTIQVIERFSEEYKFIGWMVDTMQIFKEWKKDLVEDKINVNLFFNYLIKSSRINERLIHYKIQSVQEKPFNYLLITTMKKPVIRIQYSEYTGYPTLFFYRFFSMALTLYAIDSLKVSSKEELIEILRRIKSLPIMIEGSLEKTIESLTSEFPWISKKLKENGI